MASSTIVFPIFPTPWVQLPQFNGFFDFDTTSYRTLSYRRLSNGVIELLGVVRNSASLPAFTKITQLPVDAKPGTRHICFGKKDNTAPDLNRFDILPNGDVMYITGNITDFFNISVVFGVN